MLSIPKRHVCAAFLLSFSVVNACAQSAPSADDVRAAFSSLNHIGSVALDGTFVSTEGSLVQQGNTHLVAGSDGGYSITLGKTAGSVGESRKIDNSDPTCSWVDATGREHEVSGADCQVPAWFLPELPTLFPSQPSPEWKISSLSTTGSSSHVSVGYAIADRAGRTLSVQMPAIDLELSSSTLLPSKASYTIHSERSNRPVQVEIRYLDYRQISGVLIPFHIQKLLNGTVVLDITVTTATIS